LRIFKNKSFARFADKNALTDQKLLEIIHDAEDGLNHVKLGGDVIKQRVARPKEGKSAGYRVIIFYRRGEKAFFVHGYAKKDEANISHDDEQVFKKSAKIMLALSDNDLKKLITNGALTEVKNDANTI
jgi:hypothetical protein